MQIPTAKELRQIVFAMLLAASVCAVGGLFYWWKTEPEPPLGHGASLEAVQLGEDRAGERLIRLNEGNPSMMLAAYLFEEEFESPMDYLIEAGDTIEFLPIVTTPTNTPPELDVFLETDAGRRDVGRVRMASVPGMSRQVSGEILSHSATLDLNAHVGQSGRIVWRVDKSEPEPAAIAGFKYVKRRDSKPPSVLLVCSDTHRYDYSLAGRGPELMPKLTAFSAEATVYDNAFSAASWTLPSVTSVLTGRYPRCHLTGRRVLTALTDDLDRDAVPPGNFVAIGGKTYHQLTTYPQELLTLPQAMREAGYTTVLVLSNTIVALSGLHADGFEVVAEATLMPAGSLNYIAGSVLSSLPPDRPVFLYVHYLDVHEYPKRFEFLMAKRNPSDAKRAEAYLGPPEMIHESYEQTVSEFDSEFGKLLDLWSAREDAEDSMVIFYSDHGEHLFDRGHPDIKTLPDSDETKHFIPLVLNHGNSMAETLLHVPLVVKFPESLGVAPGRIVRSVSLVDIMPSVLQVAGVHIDLSELDWKSLIPGDESGTAGYPRVLFADYQLYGDEKSSIRRDNHKLTLNLTEREKRLWAESDWVLVDTALSSDEGEASQEIENKAVREELTNVFGVYAEGALEATQGISAVHSPDLDETTEQLKRLGYIQ